MYKMVNILQVHYATTIYTAYAARLYYTACYTIHNMLYLGTFETILGP